MLRAMTAIHLLSTPLDAGRRGELVYRGDLLIFKGVAPMRELCAFADVLIRETFADLEPETAQFHMDRDAYLALAGALRRRFKTDRAAKRMFTAVLEGVGVDPERTYWDWLYLRILPHGDSHSGRRIGPLGVHRDTWASNLLQQTHWWAPIYPLTAERTIAFYPDYWSRPLANTSAEWDLDELRARRREAGAAGRAAPDYPLMPEPRGPVDTGAELRPVLEPGDVLCFSGAHAHASVPNETGRARFSTEVRTVDAGDLSAGRGAPNVDGEAPRVARGWFHRISDGRPLEEAAGAPATGP